MFFFLFLLSICLCAVKAREKEGGGVARPKREAQIRVSAGGNDKSGQRRSSPRFICSHCSR